MTLGLQLAEFAEGHQGRSARLFRIARLTRFGPRGNGFNGTAAATQAAFVWQRGPAGLPGNMSR